MGLFCLSALAISFGQAQTVPVNIAIFDEFIRREQLNANIDPSNSLSNRPARLDSVYGHNGSDKSEFWADWREQSLHQSLSVIPSTSLVQINHRRPYGWGNGLMKPNVGVQFYQNVGVKFNSKRFEMVFAPEFVWRQNRSFQGFREDFSNAIVRDRFFYWNNGDFPEQFGTNPQVDTWWGQSYAKVKFGKVSIGVGTENIWWGPGQFSSLSYSNNAQGFLHAKIQTERPLEFFLGSLEFNLLSGRLEDSGLVPTSNEIWNSSFFRPLSGDWRYVNALFLSYNPKWLKGVHFGLVRTHHQYSEFMNATFADIFPAFNPFQKERFGFDRDEEGRDQQLVVFSRVVIPKAKAELYVEYGRRDHALNWREAILNPEHARAYLLGFKKLFDLESSRYQLQVRSEMIHQQESVNRFIRYPGLRGNQTWHTHGRARGFANQGEAIGVGVGVGSNAQILEASLVNGINKMGVVFERVENHQDFFYRAFGTQSEKKPWIDFTFGLVFDHEINRRLISSSRLNVIGTTNYQWIQNINSEPLDFGFNTVQASIMVQSRLLYFIHKIKPSN